MKKKSLLSLEKKKAFQNTILEYYKTSGRDLPWRHTTNPYHILISEVMLQQTQVDRVIPKYNSWLRRFPSLQSLASAPLKEVLKEWQGLGYNRRALNLHKTARILVDSFGGKIPKDRALLKTLPGIGEYTSGSILTFAHNTPLVLIETNIRSVFLEYFFSRRKNTIHDKELIPLIEESLMRKDPRKWYSALMDYGAHIKSTRGNANKKSVHYRTQSSFKGSHRELRAHLIDIILHSSTPLTYKKIEKFISIETKYDVDKTLSLLEKEGFIRKKDKKYSIPNNNEKE